MTYHEFYDRQTNPITDIEWAKLRRGKKLGTRNLDYIIVKQERIDQYFVSTVWLGINHAYGDSPPLIFETMIFVDDSKETLNDVYMERYTTEAEAIAGHATAVEWAKRELLDKLIAETEVTWTTPSDLSDMSFKTHLDGEQDA